MGFILIVYAAQLISGLVPMSKIDEANRATTFIYIMFALGIARAWELLGMSSTGVLHQLRGALVHPDSDTPPSPAAPPNPPNPADPPNSR